MKSIKNRLSAHMALLVVAAAACMLLSAGCDSLQVVQGAQYTYLTPHLSKGTTEYTSEWPENEFTALIPKPDFGRTESVMDMSEYKRFVVSLTDVEDGELEGYLDSLPDAGFYKMEYSSNDVSVGAMYQNDDGVVLSIAGSSGSMGIMISVPDSPDGGSAD